MREGRPLVAIGLVIAALATSVVWGARVLFPTSAVDAAAPKAEREVIARESVAASPDRDAESAGARRAESASSVDRASDQTTGTLVVRLFEQGSGAPIRLPYTVFVMWFPDATNRGDEQTDWSASIVDGEAVIHGLPLDQSFHLAAESRRDGVAGTTIGGDLSATPAEFHALGRVDGPTKDEPVVERSCTLSIEGAWVRLRVVRAGGGAPPREVALSVHRAGSAAREKRLVLDDFGRVTFPLPTTYVGEDVAFVVQESEEPDALLSQRIELTDLPAGQTDELSFILRRPDILVEGVFDLSDWTIEPVDPFDGEVPWLVIQRRFGDGEWEHCRRVVLEDGGAFRLHGLHQEGASYRVAPVMRSGVLEDQVVPFEPYTRGLLVQVRRSTGQRR